MCIFQRTNEPVIAVVSHSAFITFNKERNARKFGLKPESIATSLKYAELCYKLTQTDLKTHFCLIPLPVQHPSHSCVKWIQLKVIAALNHPAPDKTNELLLNKVITFLQWSLWQRHRMLHLANIYQQVGFSRQLKETRSLPSGYNI